MASDTPKSLTNGELDEFRDLLEMAWESNVPGVNRLAELGQKSLATVARRDELIRTLHACPHDDSTLRWIAAGNGTPSAVARARELIAILEPEKRQ